MSPPRAPATTRPIPIPDIYKDHPRMAQQFVYHMKGLTKTWPGGKKVLENVHLSFYPTAKIGVLGVNGSGKSTLLRIMAGIDTEFIGEGFIAEGARVGYLPQEPHLDPDLGVRGNVMLGVAGQAGHSRSLQRTGDELFRRDRRRDDAAAGRDRGAGPVGSRQPGRTGDGRARLPARRGRCRQPFRRRAPPHRALPAAARKARHAAARRTDEPSRRRDGQLARRPFARNIPAPS